MIKKMAWTECDFLTDDRTNFKRHGTTHTGVKAFKGVTWRSCLTSKSSLTKHIESVHTKKNIYE